MATPQLLTRSSLDETVSESTVAIAGIAENTVLPVVAWVAWILSL